MRRALRVVLAIVVGGVLLFWLWPSYSQSQVDPRLRALVTPYRSVVTEYNLDEEAGSWIRAYISSVK